MCDQTVCMETPHHFEAFIHLKMQTCSNQQISTKNKQNLDNANAVFVYFIYYVSMSCHFIKMDLLYAKNTIYVLKWNYKATENPFQPKWVHPGFKVSYLCSWGLCKIIPTLQAYKLCQILSEYLSHFQLSVKQSQPQGFQYCSPLDFTLNCHVFSSDLQCVFMTPWLHSRSQWQNCHEFHLHQPLCVFSPTDPSVKSSSLTTSCWTGHLKDYVWPFQIIIWGGIPVEVC